MATPKKQEEPVQTPFVNNNTNNINVNVHVPKQKRKSASKKPTPAPSSKPNWFVKAIIIAFAGLLATWLFNYTVQLLERGRGKAPVIESTN